MIAAMMIATKHSDFEAWDYIEGNLDMSIATSRYQHLRTLNVMAHSWDENLTIAMRDPQTDVWTKWVPFIGTFNNEELRDAYDIHRSLLPNEILIESDYPTYEENYDAAKIIGQVLEQKGFTPHYYYSGSKSIHIHVFFDYKCLLHLDMTMQEYILSKYKTRDSFVKEFTEYLRKLMITCWGLKIRQFDEALMKGRHLIRAEMSRNKLGYKTFLGYTWRDMSFVPYLCNEDSRIYPQVGEIKLSVPYNVRALIEDFMHSQETASENKTRKMNQSLFRWTEPDQTELRTCVKGILSDEFKTSGDGFQRGMFILANELRKVFGKEAAEPILLDWNARMGNPVREGDLRYRLSQEQEYSLSCTYIHDLLNGLGKSDMVKKCEHKI